MKKSPWLAVACTCLWIAGPVRAGDEFEDLLKAMAGDSTPDIVKWVGTGDEKAAGPAAALAKKPSMLISIGDLVANEASRIVERDGDAADAFAQWMVKIAAEVQKENSEDAAACGALGSTSLAKARVDMAAGNTIDPDVWTTAADMLIAGATLTGEDEEVAQASRRALDVLSEGWTHGGAKALRLVDHAAAIGLKAIEALPEDEELRRAVAASFKKQTRDMEGVSRQRMVAAVRSFMDVFGPLVRTDDYGPDDARAFNEFVTLSRRTKLPFRDEYVTRSGLALAGLLAYEIPETGRWSDGGDNIEQTFEESKSFRFIGFKTYDWDMVYGRSGSVRDCGGDNVKGLATLSFDSDMERMAKVRKKKKPGRGRFTKGLPAGISYTVEGVTEGGSEVRRRVFFVKAVKAETTIKITIYESGDAEDDPEVQAVYDSFDITKKER